MKWNLLQKLGQGLKCNRSKSNRNEIQIGSDLHLKKMQGIWEEMKRLWKEMTESTRFFWFLYGGNSLFLPWRWNVAKHCKHGHWKVLNNPCLRNCEVETERLRPTTKGRGGYILRHFQKTTWQSNVLAGLDICQEAIKLWQSEAANWVCLKIGYIPNYSHLIGIMIINHWV